MTVRLGLEGRCGLVIDGTTEIGDACVQRLRDEGMSIGFAASDRRPRRVARAADRRIVHRMRPARPRELRPSRRSTRSSSAVAASTCWSRPPPWLLDGSLEATAEADFRELLEANLTAPFRIARACLPAMRAQGGGSIVHIASDSGIRAAHERAATSVAAAGVIAAAELFGAEGAADGVRANAVCPSDDVGGADVASLVAWLASDDSVHVTGATLRIDAGAGAAMPVDTRNANASPLDTGAPTDKDCAPWNGSWSGLTHQSTRARRSRGQPTSRTAQRSPSYAPQSRRG